jgi:hypothetical protein
MMVVVYTNGMLFPRIMDLAGGQIRCSCRSTSSDHAVLNTVLLFHSCPGIPPHSSIEQSRLGLHDNW